MDGEPPYKGDSEQHFNFPGDRAESRSHCPARILLAFSSLLIIPSSSHFLLPPTFFLLCSLDWTSRVLSSGSSESSELGNEDVDETNYSWSQLLKQELRCAPLRFSELCGDFLSDQQAQLFE